jgi:hypothetical protein
VPGKTVPDLDHMLMERGRSLGTCRYVRLSTPEQRAAIRKHYDDGVHSWAVFSEWLRLQGAEVTGKNIEQHFAARHPDER